MLQNALPSNVQLVQVWPGGGAEVSRPEICKIRLAVLPYLFHRATPDRVLGPHILAPEGGRLSTSKKNGTTGPFCAPQPLLISQAWIPFGGVFFHRGLWCPGPWSGLYCCVQTLPLISSSDLAKYLSIYLLTYWICCVYFLTGENFHIYKIHLDLGIILCISSVFFYIKTTVSRCFRVLTNKVLFNLGLKGIKKLSVCF